MPCQTCQKTGGSSADLGPVAEARSRERAEGARPTHRERGLVWSSVKKEMRCQSQGEGWKRGPRGGGLWSGHRQPEPRPWKSQPETSPRVGSGTRAQREPPLHKDTNQRSSPHRDMEQWMSTPSQVQEDGCRRGGCSVPGSPTHRYILTDNALQQAELRPSDFE